MAIATALMTQLRPTRRVPVVWLWMFIAGLGVGPTFAVFTIVVQNAVPFHYARRRDVEPDVLPPDRRHGRAGDRRHDLRHGVRRAQIVPSMTAAGVPHQLVDGFQAGIAERRRRPQPADRDGRPRADDPGQRPEASWRRRSSRSSRTSSTGIHVAFSLAVAQTFWIGVGAAIIAAVAAIVMKELRAPPRRRRRPRPPRRRRRDAAPTDAAPGGPRRRLTPPLPLLSPHGPGSGSRAGVVRRSCASAYDRAHGLEDPTVGPLPRSRPQLRRARHRGRAVGTSTAGRRRAAARARCAA